MCSKVILVAATLAIAAAARPQASHGHAQLALPDHYHQQQSQYYEPESKDDDHQEDYYGIPKNEFKVEEAADGTIRFVQQPADKHKGSKTVVKREGHAKHIIPEHNHHH